MVNLAICSSIKFHEKMGGIQSYIDFLYRPRSYVYHSIDVREYRIFSPYLHRSIQNNLVLCRSVSLFHNLTQCICKFDNISKHKFTQFHQSNHFPIKWRKTFTKPRNSSCLSHLMAIRQFVPFSLDKYSMCSFMKKYYFF
jgi:hypothetical protein